MKTIATLVLITLSLHSFAQIASLRGQLQDPEGQAVMFANIALYDAADSTLFKVETSDESGRFVFNEVLPGQYYLVATHVGSADLHQTDISLRDALETDLGMLTFSSTTIELAEATVTATRALVEVKPDRTVFNVDGTVNSAGSDALSLLRKAPGVTVDNNDNINVLGRAGLLLYVDGKRLPLTGEDLSNYLQNLSAEQIDRIDIITNPGARYEAEGNAGIIDIRLKKDKNLGANGSVNGTFSQGRFARQNIGASGNYRNKMLNTFGTASLGSGTGFHDMEFRSYQNGLLLNETNTNQRIYDNYDYRLGADFFLAQQHTLGFMVGGGAGHSKRPGVNRIEISDQDTPALIDSILVAENETTDLRRQNTFNLNYRFDNGKGRSLNIDADYGRYRNQSELYQPNYYYDATEQILLTRIVNSFDTPSDIDIYTLAADYEEEVLGGKLGVGGRLSRVLSDNTFLVYDISNETPAQNDSLSNRFRYEENVYAGYFNYARSLGKKWNLSAGLRVEQTDATGNLQAFLPELQEPPVALDYLNWFPSAGITWQAAPRHALSLNYGRRINRPDYDVLNPFNSQLSQLSYRKGNPFLRPEIVNNLELGYTLAFRYNVKLAYSKTTDQITRLIGPDEKDPRASFITWDNLASQTIISFNISAPVEITKGWNAYFNVNASHINNQADYGNGAVVDLQAFTYRIYSQQTFDLPAGFTGEISGYYSGPGIWGGVFKYNANWSLDLGLQHKFFQDRLNARLSLSDIFYESGWDGVSEFNGLVSEGSGRWDSRRISLSLGYNFGNENVKSRRRKSGLESEAGRLGGEN